MYTHGLIAIISTKTRYGGFAKAVGMRIRPRVKRKDGQIRNDDCIVFRMHFR
jgi:hypothetical protein